MKTIKINLHSITDLITNSSTTIYTYSDISETALKEMIDEILKTFDIDKTCDEMFATAVVCDHEWKYEEYLEKLASEEYPKGIDKNTDIIKLVENVKVCKVPKPSWFDTVEETEDDSYYCPPTTLYITPKEKQYEKVAELIKKFLYSTSHEAFRDG